MDNIITVNIAGQKYSFITSPDLFSPGQLDVGSRVLIETLVKENLTGSILDIGCGYGPIGIILAKSFPGAEVSMLDNNKSAVERANENAALNQAPNAQAMKLDVTSDELEQKFDVVVSNLPWTKNISVVPRLVEFAYQHLKTGGKLYVVVNQTFRTEDTILGVFDNVATVVLRQPYKILVATKTKGAIDPLRERVLTLIKELNLTPNAIKDQYFLVSSEHRDKIVEAADINSDETVLEFGPGLGQLTEKVAPLAKKVVGLEVDQRFKIVLDQLPSNVDVRYGNAWKIVGRHMANVEFDKVIADLPYSYTEPFLHKLAHARVCPIVLTLPEKYTVTLQNHFIFSAVFDVQILFRIPRGYFYPIPKTESIVVGLKRTTFGRQRKTWKDGRGDLSMKMRE